MIRMHGYQFFTNGLKRWRSRLLIAIFAILINSIAIGDTVEYDPEEARQCAPNGGVVAAPRSTKKQACLETRYNQRSMGLELIALAGVPLGLDQIIIANFSMMDEEAEGEVIDAARNLIRCDIPTQDIKFCYHPPLFSKKCVTLRAGESKSVNWVTFKAVQEADLLCVKYNFGFNMEIGCKQRLDPSKTSLEFGCYTPYSCGVRTYQHSRNLFPITSAVVQCFEDTIDTVFFSSCCANGTTPKSNMFYTFQSSMRSTVRYLLLLYVIFFGIKVALGNDIPQKGQVMMFGLKFLLVIYFSVGFRDPALNAPGQCDTTIHSNDGITSYVVPGLRGLTNTLSSIVIGAGGNQLLCKFADNEYPYKYTGLAIWDMIDCRIIHYMGIFDNKNQQFNFLMSVIGLFLPLLFSFQIIAAIFTILFSVFIIGMVVFFVHSYLIAKFGLALLLYLAPMFVPFALFEVTKAFFTGWMQLVISFALQPVIIAGFMAMTFTVLDDIIYPSCLFTENEVVGKGPNCRAYKTYSIEAPMGVGSEERMDCQDSWGYFLEAKEYKIDHRSAVFFRFPTIPSISNYFMALLKVVVFSFLFFQFSGMIGGLAADLTGGGAPISGSNPTAALLGKAAKGIGIAGGIMRRNTESLAKQGAKVIRRATGYRG